MAKWEIIEDNKFKKGNGGKSTATRAVTTKNTKNNPKMLSEVTVVEPKTVTKNKPVVQNPNVPAQDATRVNQPYYEKKVIVNLNPSDKDDKYDYEKKLMADVDPYLAAQMELAKNKNITTGLHNGPLDAIRHTGAAAATATNVFSGGFPYLEVPFIPLKILGTNILGAAHEYTAPGEIDWQETGSDLYNNFVGSMIGSLPISDFKKQQMVVNSQKSGVLSNINNGEVDFSKFKQTGGKASTERAAAVARFRPVQKPTYTYVPAQDATKVNIPVKESTRVASDNSARNAVVAAISKPTEDQINAEKENYNKSYDWTSDYMNSPMYKKMLTQSSANTGDFNNINNTRWSNFRSTPPLMIMPQIPDKPNLGGLNINATGQIIAFPHGFGSKGTYSHELSHATDRPLSGSESRIMPQSDKNYISQHVPTTFENSPKYNNSKSYYDALKKNQPKEYETEVNKYKDFNIKYIGEDTETRARLNAIRQGAQQNNLYDPFKQGVTPEIYNDKLKDFQFEKGDKSEFDPMQQLRSVYSDEEIMYMLNHISENKKENDGTELDNLPKAKNGLVIEDPMGQWAHPGSVTRIPSNQITMQGVNYPVLGISDRGHTQMMYPGEDYSFRGKSVTEYPMMGSGGEVNFTYAGENHRVYEKESPTGNGKGVEGHIMVNHPTKNKGKWDTIDLTKITNGKVKTVAQGVASTKKWHKENPEYATGGNVSNWEIIEDLPKAGNGLISEITSTLNPKNWGVTNYSDKGSFDSAYSTAKKAGEQEFMFNNKRYNTKYAGTPRQEVGRYGVNGQQINPEIIDQPAKTTLFPSFYNSTAITGRYLPGHIGASVSDGKYITPTVNYSSMGNEVRGVQDAFRKDEKTYYSYGVDPVKFIDKAKSLPLTEKAAKFMQEKSTPSDWNLFTNNCADNVCDAFGIPRNKGLQTPSDAMDKIKEKYPTQDVTGRTYSNYVKLYEGLQNQPNEKILSQANNILGIASSPEIQKSGLSNKLISTIQGVLAEEGYDLSKSLKQKGNYDGVLGDETKKALQDYQSKKTPAPKMAVSLPGQSVALPPQFQKGGKTNIPIYVNNPNDPRLQMYSDSLYNSNLTKNISPVGYNLQKTDLVSSTPIKPTSVGTAIYPNNVHGNMKPSHWDNYVTGVGFDKNSPEYSVARFTPPTQPYILKLQDHAQEQINMPTMGNINSGQQISQPIINIPTVIPPQKDYVTMPLDDGYRRRNPENGQIESQTYKIDKVTGKTISEPEFKSSNIKIVPGGYKNGGKTKKSNWQIIEY